MRDSFGFIIVGVLFVVMAFIGFSLWQNCYSEHRDRGFSVWTSLTACQ